MQPGSLKLCRVMQASRIASIPWEMTTPSLTITAPKAPPVTNSRAAFRDSAMAWRMQVSWFAIVEAMDLPRAESAYR